MRAPGCGEHWVLIWWAGPSSVQFIRSVMSDSLQPHGLQHARLPCPSPISGACSSSCSSSQWYHSTISSCHLLLLPPSIFPSIRAFSNDSALCIRWPKYWSFSFSINPSKEYSGLISFRIWLDGSPCSQRDSQESSPTPQFRSMNSLVLSPLYSPTLTSIRNYWKNHSFDYTDLCCKLMTLLFNMLSRLVRWWLHPWN